MNDPNNSRTKLLAETFHGDWETGRAAGFARAAAAHARRRRTTRRALSAVGAAAVVAIIGFLAWRHPSVQPTLPTEPPRAMAQARGYEIISDDQLLAALKDRPLLVVKKSNGAREIVVLEN